jgi:staphylococcal nuclease domain-containing protein 1
MMSLESHAQKNKVGLHKGSGGLLRVADVNSKGMASTFLSSMQRQGKVTAVVEYVSSGSRLRVFIPRESCQATFLLAGVSCPRTAYQDKPGDPFSDEALALTRDMCFQQDVELEVCDTDARGNFVGQVFINGRSLGVELLQRGFGEKHNSAGRYGIEAELTAAQDVAKKTKVGMWEGYDPAAAAAAAAAAGENGGDAEGGAPGRTEEVIVTEVVDAITFYAQRTDAAEKLNQLSIDLNAALASGATPVESIRKNLLCAGKPPHPFGLTVRAAHALAQTAVRTQPCLNLVHAIDDSLALPSPTTLRWL